MGLSLGPQPSKNEETVPVLTAQSAGTARGRRLRLAQLLRWGYRKVIPPGTLGKAACTFGRTMLGSASANQPHNLHIDALFALGDQSFYVKGWMWGEDAHTGRLTAISPEGARSEIFGQLFRYRRADVCQYHGHTIPEHHRTRATPGAAEQISAGPGFAACFEIAEPSRRPAGWVFELRSGAAQVVCQAPPVVQDPVSVRDTVLADLALESGPSGELLLNEHLGPALTRLQAQRFAAEIEWVEQYGTPPHEPTVSIVVPLYERTDFLDQQLAHFVHDSEVQQADLVYVLDSPELSDGLREAALRLSRLYRVPFRIVTLRRNVGYSGASNAGAALARGRLLVLLNSDVLPDRPGWLGKLAAFYDTTPRIGALGPKLLYEDDSLQHAGMYFSRQVGCRDWENAHYYKGLHRSLPGANTSRPVPAVTGACLMIRRDLYEQLAGLRNLFVKGDYEDSDLCLRLIEEGYENWYVSHVEMYHLEGQSYPGPIRRLTTKYNRWLHTELWHGQIENVMARYPHP